MLYALFEQILQYNKYLKKTIYKNYITAHIAAITKSFNAFIIYTVNTEKKEIIIVYFLSYQYTCALLIINDVNILQKRKMQH